MIGTSFLRVAAHDDDYSTNAAITYSMSEEQPEYLRVNPLTGWIYVNQPISQVSPAPNSQVKSSVEILTLPVCMCVCVSAACSFSSCFRLDQKTDPKRQIRRIQNCTCNMNIVKFVYVLNFKMQRCEWFSRSTTVSQHSTQMIDWVVTRSVTDSVCFFVKLMTEITSERSRKDLF